MIYHDNLELLNCDIVVIFFRCVFERVSDIHVMAVQFETEAPEQNHVGACTTVVYIRYVGLLRVLCISWQFRIR